MSIEAYITASMLLGFMVGMWISRTAIRERDKRISELEKEIRTQRNVVKALNEDNVRLRKKNRKNKIDNHHDNRKEISYNLPCTGGGAHAGHQA